MDGSHILRVYVLEDSGVLKPAMPYWRVSSTHSKSDVCFVDAFDLIGIGTIRRFPASNMGLFFSGYIVAVGPATGLHYPPG